MGKAICVFCASSNEVPDHYKTMARELGEGLAERGHSLVYGGGKVGTMGIVAQSVMKKGGEVLGVIPQALYDREVAMKEVTELVVTDNMHQRKATMAARADGFIALPGGFGTWEEIIEIITHRFLEIHGKPCVILNAFGYYDFLLSQIEKGMHEGFVPKRFKQLYHVADSSAQALNLIEKG